VNGAARRLLTTLLVAVLALVAGGTHARAARAGSATSGEPPVLAYYYIWYTPNSWRRAKIDYPLLGRYSSDDPAVMRRHISWAKQAGISGFLVSWKDTPTLDRRLAQLVRLARAQHFHLSLVYQGLDFQREPLEVSRVRSDLVRFVARYGRDPVFWVFGHKPAIVWSGTWRFTRPDVASVKSALGDRAWLLASARSLAQYRALADVVDGNSYYWSSVDPAVDLHYPEKLAAMGSAVHAHGGLWIAPAAPGFNAIKLGGHRNVSRAGGATLRREMDVALASNPDAIGLISWNEFSENSAVEPSVRYGEQSLNTLADILHARAPVIGNLDSSSAPQASAFGTNYGLPLVGGMLGVFVVGISVIAVRRRGGSSPK
jgi:hypothetical protein